MNNKVVKNIGIIAFIVIAVGAAFGIGNKVGHRDNVENSGDEMHNTNIMSGDEKSGEDISGDEKSGEVISGEQLTDEEFVSWIDSYLSEFGEITRENSTVIDTTVTDLELGNEAKDYMESFETDSVIAEVIKHDKNAIMIVPAPDFLNIQTFYYSGDKLVLYRCEFIGIGGEANYYFRDGKKIDLKTEVEEEMNFQEENAEEILKRSEEVYNKFMKQ